MSEYNHTMSLLHYEFVFRLRGHEIGVSQKHPPFNLKKNHFSTFFLMFDILDVFMFLYISISLYKTLNKCIYMGIKSADAINSGLSLLSL